MRPNNSGASEETQQGRYLKRAAHLLTIGGMEEKRPRSSKVTDEHRTEAAKLRAIWQRQLFALRQVGAGTQESFGAKYGIGNQAAVGFFLNGKTPLSLKAALGFARGLGCSVQEFSPRLAAQIAGEGSDQQVLHVSDAEARVLAAIRALGPNGLERVAAFVAGAASAQPAAHHVPKSVAPDRKQRNAA
jgi:hypothetical protein